MSADLELLERDVVDARRRVQADLARLRAPGAGGLKGDLTAGAERIVTDVKDRLAANPAATLAIGAGLAWRFAHRPPIASLLVGYGVLSLMRTDPAGASTTYEYAARAREAGEAAVVRAKGLADATGAAAAESLHTVRASAAEAADALKGSASQWREQATQAAADASATMRERAPQLMQAAQRDKDAYLLGFAAAALAAAIGISAQRRAH